MNIGFCILDCIHPFLIMNTKLTNINSVMFKPLSLVIIGIIVFLIYLKYNSIVVQQETIELNNKYYSFDHQFVNFLSSPVTLYPV